MELDDLGLGATVSDPDMPGWSGENSPDKRSREALREAFRWLEEEKAALALGALLGMGERAFSEAPSFAMRWRYSLAVAYFLVARDVSDTESEAHLLSALDHYKRALSLAVSHGDELSQVTLHRMYGEVYHDLRGYDQALSEYLTALTALRRHRERNMAGGARFALAEIKLRMRVARQRYVLGQFRAALDNIAEAREIRARLGGPATTEWDRAAEEWIEAMILRAESQRCGGDLKLLRVASRLFKRAEKRLEGDREHSDSLRRLYIQIAETHLDLAEHHRSEGRIFSYTKNMRRAGDYAVMASDALHRVTDTPGQAMATLTLLRHDHLSVMAYELPSRMRWERKGDDSRNLQIRALASRIYDVEQKAVEMNDLPLIARAATLRADVLASMRDLHAALVVYYFAIATYERAGARGESSRAVYGVRRVLDIV
jgi:tetratricopeptide (TPR) repeat protein